MSFTSDTYINPAEMGFYYLKSRYYSPGLCRFINADSLIVSDGQLDGMNLYTYCKNNPINYKDPTGHFLEKIVEFVEEAGMVIQQLAQVYMVCSGVAAADGPLPVLDVIGGTIAGVATLGAIGVGAYHWATKKREEPYIKTGDMSVSITYQSPANYWTADLVKGQIVGGVPLTAHQASIHVASGNSIMCRNQMAILMLWVQRDIKEDIGITILHVIIRDTHQYIYGILTEEIYNECLFFR